MRLLTSTVRSPWRSGLTPSAGTLLQLRRALPWASPSRSTTRPFDAGATRTPASRRQQPGLRGAPEQGGWTVEGLASAAEPWFDPGASCSTTRRPARRVLLDEAPRTATAPDVGEIYVIAVDPTSTAAGSGARDPRRDRLLAAAASRWGCSSSTPTTRRPRLYERLGFDIHRTDRAYSRESRAGPVTTPAVTRYDVDRAALAELLDDEPRYRVDQVWNGLYQQLAEPDEMTDLPPALRAASRRSCRRHSSSSPSRSATAATRSSCSGSSTAAVETVLMLYPDRATVCVSTQAGCAMGCGFCATGQAGFERHLTRARSSSRSCAAARRRASRPAGRQRRVHGHGRAARQRRRRVGRGRTAPRRRRAVGARTSRSPRSASCPASAASPSGRCR